jgi:transcriptional regulator with XRE-family HTH domain
MSKSMTEEIVIIAGSAEDEYPADLEARGDRPSYSRKEKNKTETEVIAARVKARRRYLKLTQLYMAQRLDIQRATYGHYENAYNRIPTDILRKIAPLLRTNVGYLLGTSEDNAPEPEEQKQRQTLNSYFDALAPEYRPALVAVAQALFESLK